MQVGGGGRGGRGGGVEFLAFGGGVLRAGCGRGCGGGEGGGGGGGGALHELGRGCVSAAKKRVNMKGVGWVVGSYLHGHEAGGHGFGGALGAVRGGWRGHLFGGRVDELWVLEWEGVRRVGRGVWVQLC